MFMFAYHLKINDEYEHPYDIENDNIVNTIIHCRPHQKHNTELKRWSTQTSPKNTTQKTKKMINTDLTKNTTQKTKKMINTDLTKNTTQN
jgi:hypothetical protein